MIKNVFMKNQKMTLVGRKIALNSVGPDFKVVSKDLSEVGLDNFKDKIKLINFFPSLDTKVCDLQVKEFNKTATSLSNEVVLLSISKDLPFAQKRFCDFFKINNIEIFSDYKTSSFGINYGVLIKELNLLARGVIILDKNNIIRYIQLVEEITNSIDYKEVIKNLNKVVENPTIQIEKKLTRCLACEDKVEMLSKEKILEFHQKNQSWELLEDRKITKEFKFKDFIEAKYFLDIIAVIAQEQNHHPRLILNFNKVKVVLTTHFIRGLSENDFIMANIIDQLTRS